MMGSKKGACWFNSPETVLDQQTVAGAGPERRGLRPAHFDGQRSRVSALVQGSPKEAEELVEW